MHHTDYLSTFFRRTFGAMILLILLAMPFPAAAAGLQAVKSNSALLTRLDSLISNHDRIIAAKEARIARLRTSYSDAVSDRRRLEAARTLYREYQVYDPDSAMHYARTASTLAMRTAPDDADLLASCRLDEAFIYATQGFPKEAASLLDHIAPDSLSLPMKIRFYEVGQYLYSSESLFVDEGKDKHHPALLKSNAYRDSLVRLDPDHLPEVLWAPIAMQIDSDDYKAPQKEVELLEAAVEKASEPSRENAINAYWLARHYESVGDDVKMVRYMTLAAIYDAEIENREIAAITELANWLFAHGDLDRAYTYLIYSSDQATAYHNRARVMNVGSTLPAVREAYLKALAVRDRRLHIYLWILVALAVGLAVNVAFIVVDNRRLTRARRELTEVNAKLEDSVKARDEAIKALEKANVALSDANKVLSESDKVKLGLVTLAFQLTSEYINAIDDFRKKLLRKFRLKEYVELGVMLNDQELIREQYKDFYVAFDHTILSIFPDFVEEYNASATEEARFDPEQVKKSQTLNTRLRIHALRRLGVDKSADIAKMLNVSIRTVYNNRS